MRSLLLRKSASHTLHQARSVSWLSCRVASDFVNAAASHETADPPGAVADQLIVPVGPAGFTVQPKLQSSWTNQTNMPFSFGQTEVWQAFNKAPDDNPPDQPKTTLDRQDVPPTKPGMDAPTSPDATNPEIDRSDYTAPGTNPDVAENDKDSYKPSQDSVDDLKKRGRSGKGKLPGSPGQKASAGQAQMPFSAGVMSMLQRSGRGSFSRAGQTASFHVYAVAPDNEEANVGKDQSAGATHPNLPGRKPDDITDKSDAPKGFDPNPDLMEDQSNANAPGNRKAEKTGETVDQDNTIASSSEQPRKSPEDVAPEQAGS